MYQKNRRYANWFKRISILFLALFILVNVLSAIQAYSFTHFKEKGGKPNLKLGFSTLFTGVEILKPKANTKPEREYQTLKIPIEKEKFLEAWLLNPQIKSRGLVILFHGFKSEKSSMLGHAYAFLDLGYKVMLVDFMGAGNSYGTRNTVGYYEAENVKQSYEYATQKLKENHIIFCGFSMGAVAIIKAQHDYNLDVSKIILEAPYGKMIDAVKKRFEEVPYVGEPASYLVAFWGGALNGFNAFSMNPEEYIKKVSTPTLLLYGGKDPKIPMEESLRIFTNSGSTEKEFKVFPNSYHESYLNRYPKEWRKKVQDFLNV